MSAVVVTTTTDSEKAAQQIADKLLNGHLAACVQIVPSIESRYWWEGKLESAKEWLCLIKTTDDCYQRVEDTIRAEHSYDEPEIVAVPITKGSKGYLDWVAKEANG